MCTCNRSSAQQPLPLTAFDGLVAFTGCPNGLFHTAFHGNKATRFLVIKAIASNDTLAKEFHLNEAQVAAIEKLRPIETVNCNDSPEELSLDRQYYSMLTGQQLDWLTFLALRFDGLAALTHKSVAERVGISEALQVSLRQIVARNRDSIVLPHFRARFASNRSEFEKAKDADFDTRLLVMTNFQLITVLNENERDKLAQFVKTREITKVVQLLEDLAPLPDGLGHLHELRKSESGQTDR